MKTVPKATYRLQFHAGFTLDHAAAIANYLADLGISHIYASPYLQAAPGSSHGYDVIDHTTVNRDLGGNEGHDRFCRALAKNNLGQVLDLVPNHMAISHPVRNKWWWDILKNGPASQYERFFDIDRDPPERRLGHRLLLPVLADHYGRELEAGKIRVTKMAGDPVIDYNGMRFPLSPASVIAHTESSINNTTSPEPGKLAETLNADADALDHLLQNQHYRLAFWRTAAADLNYRRFFAINDLAGIRVEDERVFTETHQLVLKWLRQGIIDGLRIDHPDGLSDPETYFMRLRSASPEGWIIVEKILHTGEDLPSSWPVSGTTGYDFLNLVAGLFIDPAGEAPLTEFYTEFAGEKATFKEIVRQCKHQVMDDLLGADVSRLTELMIRICEKHWFYRDYSRSELRIALREILAEMPVYRTYVRIDSRLRDTDRRIIETAVGNAEKRQPKIDPALFTFIKDLLCRLHKGNLEHEFILRFQQLSGPVTAKGIEDTAFYRYHRLSCLNEVGGNPGVMGISTAHFHNSMIERSNRYPRTMLSTATHDTKRSEDVRARMALLSEIPRQWAETVRTWSKQNAIYRRNGLLDKNTEYLLYQTLVGAWPINASRTWAYMEKAAREARVHTSWEQPNPLYEKALHAFVTNVLEDSIFVTDLAAFVTPLVSPGRINSLSQTLIKLTSPGVPDIYQGTELWDMSLVDPDNRRPVDYTLRRELLNSLDAITPEAVMAQMEKGLPKLYLTRQTLWLRKHRPGMFTPSSGYRPLLAKGTAKKHIVAYMRGEQAVVVVPRLIMGFSRDWQDTRIDLPEGHWHNLFTDETVTGLQVLIADLLARFPVALLIKEE